MRVKFSSVLKPINNAKFKQIKYLFSFGPNIVWAMSEEYFVNLINIHGLNIVSIFIQTDKIKNILLWLRLGFSIKNIDIMIM